MRRPPWIARYGLLLLLSIGPTTRAADSHLPSIVELRDAAEAGDPKAQEKLAQAHFSHQEWSEALKWFRKAADQGSIEALVQVGKLYAEGKPGIPGRSDPIPKDSNLALRCLATAADAGHSGAQCEMGLRYRDGRGLPRDQAEAYKWFKLAAPTDQSAKAVYLPEISRTAAREVVAEGEHRAAAFKPKTKATTNDLIIRQIVLQAIAGSGVRRTAMINGSTFNEGEVKSVTILGDRVRVTCLKITSKEATITVGDSPTEHELRLGAAR